MTKAKSSNAAAAQTAAPEVQTPAAVVPSFFESLHAFAAPISKLSNAQAQQDPVLAMRTRFSNAVAEQITLVKSAADKSRWFKKQANGAYQITVRNGNTALKLGENTFFEAADAAKAEAFLEAIAAGAKAGELDTLLKDSQRKPRAPKKAAETQAPAAAPAPAADNAAQ